jgi:hypothetical protein
MRAYCRNKTKCRWAMLLAPFGEAPDPARVLHFCCDICRPTCKCELCAAGNPPALPYSIPPPPPSSLPEPRDIAEVQAFSSALHGLFLTLHALCVSEKSSTPVPDDTWGLSNRLLNRPLTNSVRTMTPGASGMFDELVRRFSANRPLDLEFMFSDGDADSHHAIRVLYTTHRPI